VIRAGIAEYPPPDARGVVPPAVTLIFAGVGVLVAAQILGIYALVTRKADLLFSLLVLAMVAIAAALAAYGAYATLD
jgi:hypothetical protein